MRCGPAASRHLNSDISGKKASKSFFQCRSIKPENMFVCSGWSFRDLSSYCGSGPVLVVYLGTVRYLIYHKYSTNH